MNIVICDDEKAFADKLKKDIHKYISQNELYCNMNINCICLYSPDALMAYAEHVKTDILFLDISMPGTDGIKIAESFYDFHPETLIIFTTNYEEYVFLALRFNPFRYLRKSTLDNELEEALTSALKNLLISDKYLTVNNRSNCTQISVHRIIYIEKEKSTNYLNIVCKDEKYRDRRGINELTANLDPSLFIRINIGTVINIKHIISIKEDRVILSNNAALPISKKYCANLKAKYITFMREREKGFI